MAETYLHHNKGVPKLAYTVRIARSIHLVKTQPFNRILKDNKGGSVFLVTKGICADARKFGRIKLTRYMGNWPRCALFWKVIREAFNG